MIEVMEDAEKDLSGKGLNKNESDFKTKAEKVMEKFKTFNSFINSRNTGNDFNLAY